MSEAEKRIMETLLKTIIKHTVDRKTPILHLADKDFIKTYAESMLDMLKGGE